MKTICTSFLVGAALLVGCTNNEYPASKAKYRLPQGSTSDPWFQRAMERSAREAEMKIELEAAGYKIKEGGGLY